MAKLRWLVIWTERVDGLDYSAGYGIGPRMHPRFQGSKVVKNDGRRITLVREAATLDSAKDMLTHISSWLGPFDSHIERNQ